jgi:hypothetical protein
MTTREQKLVDLIRKFPGLDGIALKGKGWRPQVHGSLRDAQNVGLIEYRNGGWYVCADGNLTDETPGAAAVRGIIDCAKERPLIA